MVAAFLEVNQPHCQARYRDDAGEEQAVPLLPAVRAALIAFSAEHGEGRIQFGDSNGTAGDRLSDTP
jgi:hypothetical protein